MRDDHLRKPDYFDSDKYPRISMQSVKFEKTGPISFNGTFRLTIKEITKEIIIPFSFIKIQGKTEFKGNFSINRRDFGVGEKGLTLADKVDITISTEVSE